MKRKIDIMDHDALIERIMKLDLQTLEAMSPEVMARLTNRFDESLVRKLLYVETTNYGQRKLIKLIKVAYESWMKDDLVWGITKSYPEYMEELQMDIECGLVITEKGTFEEDSWAKLTNSLIHSNAVPLKAIKKGIQSVLSEDERISVVDDDNLKSITEEQPNSISYPNESETDNNNAPININENQSANENLRQQLADAQKTIAEQTQTINEQQAELERLTTMNEVLNNQIERFEGDTPEMDIDEDTALSIKESIIFFSSIMGCNLSKEDISQTNLARLISKFTQRPKESIRPKIVDINTERENNAKDHTAFSDGVHQAAVNVCALIENAMEGLNKNPLPYSCKQAVENIRNIYKSSGRKIELHEIAEAKKSLKKI